MDRFGLVGWVWFRWIDLVYMDKFWFSWMGLVQFERFGLVGQVQFSQMVGLAGQIGLVGQVQFSQIGLFSWIGLVQLDRTGLVGQIGLVQLDRTALVGQIGLVQLGKSGVYLESCALVGYWFAMLVFVWYDFVWLGLVSNSLVILEKVSRLDELHPNPVNCKELSFF